MSGGGAVVIAQEDLDEANAKEEFKKVHKAWAKYFNPLYAKHLPFAPGGTLIDPPASALERDRGAWTHPHPAGSWWASSSRCHKCISANPFSFSNLVEAMYGIDRIAFLWNLQKWKALTTFGTLVNGIDLPVHCYSPYSFERQWRDIWGSSLWRVMLIHLLLRLYCQSLQWLQPMGQRRGWSFGIRIRRQQKVNTLSTAAMKSPPASPWLSLPCFHLWANMNINNLDTSPNLSVRTKFYVQSNQSISITSSKSKQFLLIKL